MSGSGGRRSGVISERKLARAETGCKSLSLWFAYPDDLLSENVSGPCIELLTSEERTRMQAFRFDRNRREYLATRLLVRSALSHFALRERADWRFICNEYGKPRVVPECGLRFNLANSLGLVVCLVGHGGEVGVDVEPYSRAGEILELAEEVFAQSELAHLQALREDLKRDRALSLWTLKEAYIKARGMGLALPLKEIAFLFDGSGQIRLELGSDVGDDASRWSFCLVDRAEHRVAIVVEDEDRTALEFYECQPVGSAHERLHGIAEEWSPRFNSVRGGRFRPLMAVVLPLLLYGVPVVPLLRGLPQWITRSIE